MSNECKRELGMLWQTIVDSLIALGVSASCVAKDPGDDAAGTKTSSSGDPSSSSVSSATGAEESESGGTTESEPTWPDSCDGLTEQTCGPSSGQYQCVWVDVLSLTVAAAGDTCEQMTLQGQCVAVEVQGNGCVWGPPPESCSAPVPPYWFRETDEGLEFIMDLCEELPFGWNQCWVDPSKDVPECECACFEAG